MIRIPMFYKFKQRIIGILISYLNPGACISGFRFLKNADANSERLKTLRRDILTELVE
jgi:hypothetical protein